MHKGIGSGWVGSRCIGRRRTSAGRARVDALEMRGERHGRGGGGGGTGCIGTKPLLRGDIVLIIIIYDLSGEAVSSRSARVHFSLRAIIYSHID